MSRFDHLEMGDWKPEPSEGEPEDGGVINEEHHLQKARECFDGENYERALAYYSRALQYNINIEEAWFGQVRCLTELQELHEAVMWSDRAMERFPNSSQVLAARAVAESRLGRHSVSIGYSDASFQAQGVTPFAWIARGEVLVSRNETNARACFAKAVEMAPKEWSIRAAIARAYFVRNCYHQALEHYRHASRLDPERFTCWYWIGKCCQSLGQAEEAKRAYMRAAAARPDFVRAREAVQKLNGRTIFMKIKDSLKRNLRMGCILGGLLYIWQQNTNWRSRLPLPGK